MNIINPKTIKDSIKFAKENAKVTNQSELDMYDHLLFISHTELWRKDSYYEGSQKLKYLQQKHFGAFMQEIFGKSTKWFNSMNHILLLPDGKNLLLTYGRENMVTYLSMSPENRELVLSVAKDRPTSNFYRIMTRNNLKGAVPKSLKVDPSEWEKKYNKLKVKYDNLRSDYEDLEARYEQLKSELTTA